MNLTNIFMNNNNRPLSSASATATFAGLKNATLGNLSQTSKATSANNNNNE
jgi:hypothetical protein